MQTVNIHEAKTQFSKFVDQAETRTETRTRKFVDQAETRTETRTRKQERGVRSFIVTFNKPRITRANMLESWLDLNA